eukprot:g25660.t1
MEVKENLCRQHWCSKWLKAWCPSCRARSFPKIELRIVFFDDLLRVALHELFQERPLRVLLFLYFLDFCPASKKFEMRVHIGLPQSILAGILVLHNELFQARKNRIGELHAVLLQGD